MNERKRKYERKGSVKKSMKKKECEKKNGKQRVIKTEKQCERMKKRASDGIGKKREGMKE